MKAVSTITIIIVALVIIGEIQCIYKAVTCNWEPVGKAEVVYSIGAVSGLGAIIGWIDIKDK